MFPWRRRAAAARFVAALIRFVDVTCTIIAERLKGAWALRQKALPANSQDIRGQ